MLKLATFILVALIKTPGEGGAIAVPYATEYACEAALAEMQDELGAQAPNPRKPQITVQVLGTCIAGE